MTEPQPHHTPPQDAGSPPRGAAHAQAWSHASRRYAQWRAQPTWVRKLATGVVLLVAVGLAAILVVASLLIGLVVVGVGAIATGLASVAGRLRGNAPPTEGRKNVRVIVRQNP